MLNFIISKSPQEFYNRENWLGFKMSPHQPMIFINSVSKDGVETNEGFYEWRQCSINIISTIYQRLKLNEKLSK